MKKLLILFPLLVICAFTVGCSRDIKIEYVYPNNPEISNKNGIPHDSLTNFFPDKIKINDSIVVAEFHEYFQGWFSEILNGAKEPILYNNYLGHDIYRFTWVRAFNLPVIITLHKDKKKVWLTAAKLTTVKDTIFIKNPDSLPNLKHAYDVKFYKNLIIRKRYAAYDYYLTKNLSLADWNQFNLLLNQCNYLKLNPTLRVDGKDGAEWIIEEHLKHRYWIVDRWSPSDKFFNCGKYLIDLSGIDEMIY